MCETAYVWKGSDEKAYENSVFSTQILCKYKTKAALKIKSINIFKELGKNKQTKNENILCNNPMCNIKKTMLLQNSTYIFK